jgi:phosphohistidine phosphatase
VGPEVDPRRPLSEAGRASVARLAAEAATRGARPATIWHSGKLRARQTAEAFWKACNPFADFSASKDLQPGDSPDWLRDRLIDESRDLLVAGHFPHLPQLCALLTSGSHGDFPQHGIVALERGHDGSWKEVWRAQ